MFKSSIPATTSRPIDTATKVKIVMTLVKPSFVEAIMLSLMKNSNNCYLIEWYMLYGKICNEENPLCYSIETGFTTMFATCAT